MNISYLTPAMIDYIDTPIPYIIGMPRNVWKQIPKKKKESLKLEVIIYDIDKSKLKSCIPLPSFSEDSVKHIHEVMFSIVADKNKYKDVLNRTNGIGRRILDKQYVKVEDSIL